MYLAIISLSWVLGIFIATFFNIPLPLILIGFLPVGLMFFYKKRIRQLVLASICIFAFFGAILFYPFSQSLNNRAEPINLPGYCQFKGIVESQPEVKDKYTCFNVSVKEIKTETGWQMRSGKVLVLVQRYPEYKYGDELLVSGNLEKPPVFDDFDYQTYLARNDIYFITYSPRIDITARISGFNFLGWIYDLRSSMSASLAAALPEPQAALSQGIVLGIRSFIPESLKTNFSITGTTHLLAISGVNLTIITGLLITLGIWLFGRRYCLYVWMAIVLIWFYFFITGAQAPVFRATIMATIFLFAELLGRQKNVFGALSLSAAVMTVINPEIIFDVSFQLTYAAMLGLIFIATPLNNRIHQAIFDKMGDEGFKVKTAILISDSLSVSLGAIMAVWPIIVSCFGTFSIVGPLATLLIAPALPLIIVLGCATSIAGLINPLPAQIIGLMAWLPISYLLTMVNLFANIPFAAIHTAKIDNLWIYAYYTALIILLFFRKNITRHGIPLKSTIQKIISIYDRISDQFTRLPLRIAVLTLLVVAFFTTCAAAAMPDKNLHVSFLDVGEGDAILIQDGTQNILIDGGPSPQAICSALSTKLSFWDRKIDLIILTHPHLDHLNGLVEVLKRYQVKHVLSPDCPSDSPVYIEWLKMIQTEHIPFTSGQSGQKIILNHGSELEIFNTAELFAPDSDIDMENQGIVIRLSRKNVSFLLTSDIDEKAERKMLENRLVTKSTIIKVAHHGSNFSSSSEFLTVSQPRYAVISTGANNRSGHPGKQTLDRLIKSTGGENNIFRTDKSGTIEFTTDGERLWVKKEH